MRGYDEYKRTATAGAPFTTNTDWECWRFSVCMGGGVSGRRCVHDDNVDRCPLIRLSLADRTPAEWTGTTGAVIFRCTEKTTLTEQRAAEAAEERARIEAEHYPLFDPPGAM